MCDDIFDQKNRFIDQVLAERRTYRLFTPHPPQEEDIRRILHAGLLAPFSAPVTGGKNDFFRRFFVIRNGSESMNAVKPLLIARVNELALALKQAMERDPALRAKALPAMQRLAMIQQRGVIPGVGTAPFYIVVAERRGYPPLEAQSLAHCLENMWLKAAALDLGFQPVSVTAQMADDPAFCAILGIVPGEWELAGCAVGYPQDELSPAIRPPVEDLTRWLD